jgi:hypothetical protein
LSPEDLVRRIAKKPLTVFVHEGDPAVRVRFQDDAVGIFDQFVVFSPGFVKGDPATRWSIRGHVTAIFPEPKAFQKAMSE